MADSRRTWFNRRGRATQVSTDAAAEPPVPPSAEERARDDFDEVESWRILDLLEVPAVAAAAADAPEVWTDVLDRVDEPIAMTTVEVAEFAGISWDGDTRWSVFLQEELYCFVDVWEQETPGDVMLATLARHPAVLGAAHGTTESYTVETDGSFTPDTFCALALRAIIGAYRHAEQHPPRH